MNADAPSDIRTYRDLVAWQKGLELALLVYRVTKSFPQEERFGLVAQMRGSAASVPDNIAEGYGRGGKTEFRRYLRIARASLFELQTHAELARRLEWIKGDALAILRELTHEVDAVLAGLIRPVNRRRN